MSPGVAIAVTIRTDGDPGPGVPAVALELVYDLVVALLGVVASCVLAPAKRLVSLSEGLHDQWPLAAGVVEDTPDFYKGARAVYPSVIFELRLFSAPHSAAGRIERQ